MLRLGFRNIVTPPNKGWTWSNPSADLLPLCKEGGCYNCIQVVNYHAGYQEHIRRLGCVADVAMRYEDRVQSMAKDFHSHQKRYMKIFLCFTIMILK